jgi:hypothetical protein
VGDEAAPTFSPEAEEGQAECLTVLYEMNSPETQAVFDEMGLQGGGATWAPILMALAHRHGTGIADTTPPPGYPGFGAAFRISTPWGSTWFSLDEESEAAVLCTTDNKLFKAISKEYENANGNRQALEQALKDATPHHLE